MAVTQLQRDPFARASLMRESHDGAGRNCTWCGYTKRTMYTYWWEGDGSSRNFGSLKLFCSVGCWRAYTGG